MDFELHVVRGRSASQALKLTDGVNTVGRQDDCTVRIKSSQVSRKHCEIFETKGKLVVKDLGSANGTYVNGKKVAGQQAVEPGDELTIGGIKLKVARVGEAPAPAKGKPSDTAVVDAVPVNAGGDDEFEIDFDEDNAVEAVLVEEALEVEIDDEPAPPPAAAAPAKKTSAPASTPAPKAAPAPEPAPAPAEPDNADEAIADFLLDIKLDEED